MAIIGWGSSVAVNDGPSSTFVDFPDVISITTPSDESNMIDISSMDSPNKVKEFIPGMVESAEWSFTLRYDDTQFERAFDLRDVSKSFEVTAGESGVVLECTGYIKKVEMNLETENVADFTVTVKNTGATTIGA